MIKLKLKEDLEADYKGSYSDIDRETFDKIVSLDPTARPNQLGSFAKQLLLRCYRSGDTEFLNRPEEVKNAIQNFIRNVRSNKDVEGKYKNPSYYKTVGDFIDFVNDPTKEIEGAAKEDQPKENKLDKIYNSYYKDKLSREDFDKIVSIEDEKLESLGLICKNFILPKFINGTDEDKSYILNNIDKLKNAVIKFNKNRNSLNTEHQNLEGFETVKDFIEINVNGESSTLVNYLRGLGSEVWAECNYLGSTALHDIFQPTTRRAAAYIAGGDKASLWSPAKNYNAGTNIINKDSPDAYTQEYTQTAFAHWCTAWHGDFWDRTGSDYRGSSQGIYYDVMAKGSALWDNERMANYQFGIGPDGTRYGAADGYEHYNEASIMFPRLVKEDPEILEKFLEISETNPTHRRLGLIQQVAEYSVMREFGSKPLSYNKNTIKELTDRYGSLDTLKMIVKELIIEEGITTIPTAEFHGWTGVEKITFPKSLKKIRAQAFKGCISLQLLELPPELEYIGGQAFASCINLHGTIQIPLTLTYIGDKAFEDTNIKALSIPSTKEGGSISIHPDDWDWYAKKAKVVGSSENESLNEDILDENIPFDLANAYKTTNYRAELPNSSMNYLPGGSSRRRYNNYDYKNSEYREITKEEALRLLRDDRANAKYLRFLYNGELIQFENNLPGEVHPIYGGDIVMNITNSRGDIQQKKAKQCTMNQLVNNVDKIYWTDEYDHPLSDEKKTSRDQKDSRMKGIGGNKISVPDTGNHGNKNSLGLIVDYSDDLPVKVSTDDGEELSHDDLRTHLKNYNSNLTTVQTLKQRYSKYLKIYSYYKDNEDMYDEDELNDILSNLKERIKSVQNSYVEAKNLLSNEKRYLNIAFNQEFITKYNEAKNNYLQLRDQINHYEKVISESEYWLRSHKTDNVKDNITYKKLQKSVEESKNKISDLKTEQEDLKITINDWEEQIKALQAKIDAGKNRISYIDTTELPKAIEIAEKSEAEIEDKIEELVEESSREMTKIQSNLEEAKRWFVEHPGLGRTYTLPNKSEMRPDVADKLNKRSNTDFYDNQCLEKFGIHLDELKEMCKWNATARVSIPGIWLPRYNLFLDRNNKQLNNLDEVYDSLYKYDHDNTEKVVDRLVNEIIRKYREQHPDTTNESSDKFGGLSFEQLKEIFTYNFDEDCVNLQDDGAPFVTPFLDMGATTSFNSFDEVYRYWESEEGVSREQVDEWILKYLEAFNDNRQMSEFMTDLVVEEE